MGLLDYFSGGNGYVDQKQAEAAVNGGNAKNLFDMFSGDEKKAALKRGLLAAGLNILAADPSNGGMSAIAQGGLQGVNAYDDQLQRIRQQKLQGYQMDRQQKQDQQADTTFNNQQTVFSQSQEKTKNDE